MFPVTLEMHLPHSCSSSSYPHCSPVVLLREATEEGDKDGISSPLSIWSVRREVSQALARLVRSDELRGGAVMFECCLWVQETAVEDGEGGKGSLRAVLEGLAEKNMRQRMRKRQLQEPEKTSESSCAGQETNSTSSINTGASSSSKTSSSSGIINGDNSISNRNHRQMSKKESSRLSETLLQAWQLKTGEGGGNSSTSGQSDKKEKGLQAEYRRFQQARQRLPAAAFKDQLLAAIDSHQVVLVSGETG